MQCIKCGEVLPDDSLFCQFCGTALSAAKESAAVAPEAQPCPAVVSEGNGSVQPAKAIRQMVKKINKKHLLIVGAAVILVVMMGLFISQAVLSGQQDAAQLPCPACGKTVAAEHRFCRHCGEPLGKEPLDSSATSTTAVPVNALGLCLVDFTFSGG